jgi:transposase-like protein
MSEIIYTQEIAEQLPAMFNNGETIQDVCLKLGITPETFKEWKDKYPLFNCAAEMGEMRAEVFYEDLLLQASKGELKDENLDFKSIMELMQKRFPEEYDH